MGTWYGGGLLVTIACLAVSAAPARAEDAGDVDATVTVTAGELTIAVPTAADLGSGAPGTDLTAQLGTVTVLDERGDLSSTWVATVAASDFTTDGADATIPADTIVYWSGPATQTVGAGAFVPGQLTSADAVRLDLARIAFTRPTGGRANSASWNPTLSVHLPLSAVAGTYTGTVTHSVS
jgi:hypothetical protein